VGILGLGHRWRIRPASRAHEEGEMRALHCACGHRLVANDDEGLVQQVLDHAHEVHPEMNLDEGQAREMVAAEASDAPDPSH
jgi:predicted small metal-binding protein